MTAKQMTEFLASITTLRGLYDFRNELKTIADMNSPQDNFLDTLSEKQAANYFIARIDARIKNLEEQGVFLDQIGIKQTSQTEK